MLHGKVIIIPASSLWLARLRLSTLSMPEKETWTQNTPALLSPLTFLTNVTKILDQYRHPWVTGLEEDMTVKCLFVPFLHGWVLKRSSYYVLSLSTRFCSADLIANNHSCQISLSNQLSPQTQTAVFCGLAGNWPTASKLNVQCITKNMGTAHLLAVPTVFVRFHSRRWKSI